jgi:hypothetical protein
MKKKMFGKKVASQERHIKKWPRDSSNTKIVLNAHESATRTSLKKKPEDIFKKFGI